MLIKYPNLAVFGWKEKKKGNSLYEIFSGIIKKKIGYQLEAQQMIYNITYAECNEMQFWRCKILKVSKKGVTFSARIPHKIDKIYLPWEKTFKTWQGEKFLSNLEIRPVPALAEDMEITSKEFKERVKDNIDSIWENPRNRNEKAKYIVNFNNFEKLGQISIEEISK